MVGGRGQLDGGGNVNIVIDRYRSKIIRSFTGAGTNSRGDRSGGIGVYRADDVA